MNWDEYLEKKDVNISYDYEINKPDEIIKVNEYVVDKDIKGNDNNVVVHIL